MAYNGSGTFTRLYNWVTDAANSIPITASRMDGEQDGIATGLSTAITKDGQTVLTANIPFNSKKITGLTNGSARTDSIALGQVQDGTYTTLGTTGGSADTYTASPSPAITAYATGSQYIIKISADNTGASTLNISAVGAKDIKKYDRSGTKVALIAGDLLQDQYYNILYDGTDIIVLNPSILLPTIQKFTSGSGTYTTPAGVAYIRARLIGAGGGGAGGGESGTGGAGSTGGNTTFGTSLLTCNGGSGADAAAGNGGAGGTASLGTGPIGTANRGGRGGHGGQQASTGGRLPGGHGAYTQFGGGSTGGYNAAGESGGNSSGGGGGGGGLSNAGGNGNTGAGGGAGGFIDAIINSPDATYAYSVGAGGTGGTAGTNGYAGGAGTSGYIEITEFYF
jgi:hypothetical protein